MDCVYDKDDIKCMEISAQARNKSRLNELMDYAKLCGYTKIGIANCFSMQKYADKLRLLLEEAGFTVFMLNCRESGLDGCCLSENLAGATCDPVSQAKYLNQCQTNLNINFGLCLGHGLIFQKHSQAEVTTLIVKDFSTGHKSIINFE